jgi:uncharacterized membrane protein YeiH
MPVSTLTLVLDLCGVFVFALSGALAAVLRKLDVVGVCVAVSTAAAVIVFFFHPQVGRMTRAVRVFDAAGLGFFAVAGTAKALAAGLGPVPPASSAC